MFQIGDTVRFTDEFGYDRESIITATNVMPDGNRGLLALEGSYGFYLRFENEVKEVNHGIPPDGRHPEGDEATMC